LSTAILTALFDRDGDAVCVSDPARCIIGWNATAERLVGYTEADVLGADPCEVLWHSAGGIRLCDGVCPSLQAYQECVEVDTANAAIRTREGRFIPVSMRAVPVMSPDGGIEAVLEIFRPLPEVGMDGLLSSITHELKTPLTAIVGFTSLLSHARYGELSPKQREFVDHIRSSGDLMSMMVANVSIGETVERGISVELKPVALSTLLSGVEGTLMPLARQKHVELTMDTQTPVQPLGDSALLRQVLFNLVANALQNTNGGRVDVTVQTQGEHVRVQVSDTGVGIPEAEQSTLFRKFSHVSGHKRGLGYGLFVAHAVVAAHGSQLELESTLDVGTRVSFHLPLRVPEAH
jgi:PAS domain S-box-containing protein